MRRILTGIIFCTLVVLGVTGFIGVRISLGLETDPSIIEDKKERKEEIADEKKELAKDLKAQKEKKVASWQQLSEITRNLSEKDKQLRLKEKEIDRKQNQIKITNGILTDAEKELGTTQTNFEIRLKAYYKSGPRGMFNLILDAEDLSDLAKSLKYTEYLLKSDERMIRTIREQRKLLMQMNDKLTNEVKEKEKLYNETWELRTSINQDKREKEAQIKRIQSNIKELEAALAELDREEMEIEFFLSAAAKGNLITNFDGSFSRPLKSYVVTSGYGMRRHPILHRRRMHNGIDLSASYGTPIFASGAGRVIFTGWKNGYGNVVMIDHGKGLATLYAHLSSIFVSVGQDLAEGQPLGKVGSTGWSTGNHLHFEIRKNGKALNPTGFVNF